MNAIDVKQRVQASVALSSFAVLGRLQGKIDEMRGIVIQMEKLCVESWNLCTISTAAASKPGTSAMSLATQVEAMEDVWLMVRDETSCKCAILVLVADALGSELGEARSQAMAALFSVFSDSVHIQEMHPSFILLQLQGS